MKSETGEYVPNPFSEWTKVTEKTGVTVRAYKQLEECGYEYIGEIDISELEPGMIVREIGALREIADVTMDDGDDYMIALRDEQNDTIEYYSPLLIQ